MALEADAGQVRRSYGLRSPRRLRIVGMIALLVALAVAVFFVLKALTGGEDKGGTVKGSAANAFTIKYPADWRPLSADELKALPSQPLSALRRKDGKGFLFVRLDKRSPRNFNAFSSALTSSLDKRLPDFQKRTAKIVQLSAGKAFFYSYVRTRKGTVQSVVIVPAGKRSYVLNTVSRGGSNDVAREIARMILSFNN